MLATAQETVIKLKAAPNTTLKHSCAATLFNNTLHHAEQAKHGKLSLAEIVSVVLVKRRLG